MNSKLDKNMLYELKMLNIAKANPIFNYDRTHKHIHYSRGYYSIHTPDRDKNQIKVSVIASEYFGTIGSRICQLRKEQNLSQLELAKRSGIPQSLISTYEKEKHAPSVENCIKLADALTTSLNYLILGIY